MSKPDKLSRTALEIIKEAIDASPSKDRNDICFNVSQLLLKKYEGMNVNYQSERMGLDTSGNILRAIDLYYFSYYSEY